MQNHNNKWSTLQYKPSIHITRANFTTEEKNDFVNHNYDIS